jgi:hypothetical protein
MFRLAVQPIKIFDPKKQFTIVLVRAQPRNHGST